MQEEVGVIRWQGDRVYVCVCVCWEEGAHPALAPRSHPLFQGPSGAAGGQEKDPQLIHGGPVPLPWLL